MTIWMDRLIKPSPTNEPPAPGAQLRNDLAVAVTVLFALFLALGIRSQVYSASQVAVLNQGALRIAYPERWVQRSAAESGANIDGSTDAGFIAVNLGSPSTYDSRVEVTSRPLSPDETLELARFERGLKLSSEVSGYRELEATVMQVLNGLPAIAATYGFVADPTRDAGATGLPVVVEGQDILFVQDGVLYVVSLRADAAEWGANAHDFAVVTNSLRLQAPPTVAAAASTSSGFTGDAQLEGGN
ncbi:MAG: hypothetical protein IAE81_21335 [Caldilineaceae bacterium]|jgi:hypothetical protein|nr:hypothetical protein [Caldilineaceae bacterium]